MAVAIHPFPYLMRLFAESRHTTDYDHTDINNGSFLLISFVCGYMFLPFRQLQRNINKHRTES